MAPPIGTGSPIATALAASPSHALLAVGLANGPVTDPTNSRIVVWSLNRHRALREIPIPSVARSVALSPDTTRIAVADGSSAQIYDTRTGSEVTYDPLDGAQSVAFSPDGRQLAIGANTTAWLQDVRTPHKLPIGSTRQGVITSVAFDPSSSLLSLGGTDAEADLVDTANGRTVARLLAPTHRELQAAAFSHDGQLLALGAWDGSISVWDVHARLALGERLRGHHALVLSLTFSPNDDTLISSSQDTTVAFRSLDSTMWERQACAIAGRNLTRAEWSLFLAGRDYRSTCPQWPPAR